MEGNSYRYAGAVEVGHGSAVKPDTGTFADGFVLPAAQNDPVLGICEEAVVPRGSTGYTKGAISGVSQTAWPADGNPASPSDGTVRRFVRRHGRTRYVAAGAINRGDRLIIADNQGRLASVVTLALAPGTSINVVGEADDDVAGANDIGYALVNVINGSKV